MNKNFIVNDFGAAVLESELNVKVKCNVDRFPIEKWEDVSEEVKNDPKIIWVTSLKGKYRRRTLTKTEKIKFVNFKN